ncbi:hypothetical protein [Nocardia sp. NPDC004604]|uniref:hypothetical protein n=1 Tax=Nocardia sp. NPDC004604 TaxID=3157013 RepID=UPI0033B5525F
MANNLAAATVYNAFTGSFDTHNGRRGGIEILARGQAVEHGMQMVRHRADDHLERHRDRGTVERDLLGDCPSQLHRQLIGALRQCPHRRGDLASCFAIFHG